MTDGEDLAAMMRLPAIACNHVKWTVNNFGVRFAFGEVSIVEGEAPEYRAAIFLPWAIVEGITQVLPETINDFKQKQELARHMGGTEPDIKKSN